MPAVTRPAQAPPHPSPPTAWPGRCACSTPARAGGCWPGVLVFAAAAWHVVSSFLVTYPTRSGRSTSRSTGRAPTASSTAGRSTSGSPTRRSTCRSPTPRSRRSWARRCCSCRSVRPAGSGPASSWRCSGTSRASPSGRCWPGSGRRAGLAQGVVAAVLVQLQPMQDSIRYGQVNAVIVALCLADLARRRAVLVAARLAGRAGGRREADPGGLLGALDRHPQPAAPSSPRSARPPASRCSRRCTRRRPAPPTGRTRSSTRPAWARTPTPRTSRCAACCCGSGRRRARC